MYKTLKMYLVVYSLSINKFFISSLYSYITDHVMKFDYIIIIHESILKLTNNQLNTIPQRNFCCNKYNRIYFQENSLNKLNFC